MKNRTKFIIAVLLLFIAVIMSITVGSTSFSFGEIADVFIKKDVGSLVYKFVMYIRLPRTIATVVTGAGLAVSGVLIQKVLSNHLASPGIIGINSGASLAISIAVFAGVANSFNIGLFAFIGALLATGLIILFSYCSKASRTTVVLAGLGVTTTLNAIGEILSYVSDDALLASRDFKIGGFSNVSTNKLFIAGFVIVIAVVIAISLSSYLDVLSLGEETAVSLGVNTKKMRCLFLALAALLASSSITVCGLLSFAGLIIPHVSKKIIGNKSSSLIAFSAICGGLFVTICDFLGRNAFYPYEIPCGIIMSIIGGPFFLWLLLNSKGGHKNA